MAEKQRLGKGLGSLLGILEREDESVAVDKQERDMVGNAGVVDINMSLIDNNPKQPRKNFDTVALNELAQSIKQYGVIQPIILVKKGERYMIVAGERRFRAGKIAGLKTIPAVVRDYTPNEIKEIALLENIQREDLNPIECAKALKQLLDDYGWTQEVLADKLGKSRPSIANTLRLLQLSPEVVDMVEAGKLSAGHARSLVVVQDPEVQLKLAKLAVTKRVTVRDLEKAVKDSQKPAKSKSFNPFEKTIEMQEFISLMERKFQTKVDIKGTEKKGKILIDYVSKEDLDRIYDLINKL
mgnify:CR=1 FL=1